MAIPSRVARVIQYDVDGYPPEQMALVLTMSLLRTGAKPTTGLDALLVTSLDGGMDPNLSLNPERTLLADLAQGDLPRAVSVPAVRVLLERGADPLRADWTASATPGVLGDVVDGWLAEPATHHRAVQLLAACLAGPPPAAAWAADRLSQLP